MPVRSPSQTSGSPPPKVRAAFEQLPAEVRPTLLRVRDLILEAAAETDGVGALVETLKWGQPSYLPARPRIGTTVRLWLSSDDRPALLVHCQTGLVDDFRRRYADQFAFEGNRALVLKPDRPIPEAALKHCVALALTYHLRKRR